MVFRILINKPPPKKWCRWGLNSKPPTHTHLVAQCGQVGWRFLPQRSDLSRRNQGEDVLDRHGRLGPELVPEDLIRCFHGLRSARQSTRLVTCHIPSFGVKHNSKVGKKSVLFICQICYLSDSCKSVTCHFSCESFTWMGQKCCRCRAICWRRVAALWQQPPFPAPSDPVRSVCLA